jgi:hypothetical protein
VRGAVKSFRALLQHSLTAENKEFLESFKTAIAAQQQLSDEVVNLSNLVARKDLVIVNRMIKIMLQILLGMRLEKERRILDDFKEKVAIYQSQLERVDVALQKKYQQYLQPADSMRQSSWNSRMLKRGRSAIKPAA